MACWTHGSVGRKPQDKIKIANPNSIPFKKSNFTYNLGGNQYTNDIEKVKDLLLERYYPQISKLKDLTPEDFVPGKIGVIQLPRAVLSEIPKIVDFEKYILFGKNPVKDQIIYKETAEGTVVSGIRKYFNKHCMEDVFIMFNQEIEGDKRGKWFERDVLVINLTKGYILNIEAKHYLTSKENMVSQWGYNPKKCKDVVEQFQKTLRFFGKKSLYEKWEIITIAYGTAIDEHVHVCENCSQYVATNEEDFDFKLHQVLDTQTAKNRLYVKDFYYLVKEILPTRLKMPGYLTPTSLLMNEEIIDAINHNIDQASTPKNIAYWSTGQYDLFYNWSNPSLRKVLFPSVPGTGKTILMKYVAKNLLDLGHKVAYIIHKAENVSTKILQKLLR